MKKLLEPSKKILLRAINEFLRIKYPATSSPVSGDGQLGQFIDLGRGIAKPRVLELGVKRANPAVSTMHRDWFPDAGEYVGTDYQEGLDVDQVADVHRLSKVFGKESFDIIVSCSSFEHFKYPVLAATEIMKTLKVGDFSLFRPIRLFLSTLILTITSDSQWMA